MKALALALLAAAAVVVLARPRKRKPEPDPYAEPVPMTAWDGTARWEENTATIRVRWTPTRTEV